jgi:hypothetical protein
MVRQSSRKDAGSSDVGWDVLVEARVGIGDPLVQDSKLLESSFCSVKVLEASSLFLDTLPVAWYGLLWCSDQEGMLESSHEFRGDDSRVLKYLSIGNDAMRLGSSFARSLVDSRAWVDVLQGSLRHNVLGHVLAKTQRGSGR